MDAINSPIIIISLPENLHLNPLNKNNRTIKRVALGFALSLGILWGSTGPAAASAWQNAQVPALAGIKSVAIVVSANGDGVQRLGLNEAKLQNLIMQQISSAGIPLHSGGPIKDKPDVACFEVDTHLVIVEDAATHRPIGLTYAIEGFILDSVATKRRAGLSAGTLGVLWKASGAHGYLPGEHIRSFGSIVQKVVNEFVQDYYTANGQKAYDTTAAKVTKQLPTITLSGTSDTAQAVKSQVASHITPTQATPLQRLIDEQNVAPPMTSYQKPREAAKPAAPPAPAVAADAAPPPVALVAPKAQPLQEAIPEDELTADQLVLLQAKAQALHQQAINLQHQVLLQQIAQLQAQAARLNESAMAGNAKKVDTAALDMLQRKRAALQKNVAQHAALRLKPAPRAVASPVKKKLIATGEPSLVPATLPSDKKTIADALVVQNPEAKTIPVVRRKTVLRSKEAEASPVKSPPQAVVPRLGAPKVANATPPQAVPQPVQAAAQPLVAKKSVEMQNQPKLTLAQMIAAQNDADGKVAAIPYNPPVARQAVISRATVPATSSVVRPAAAKPAAVSVKPASKPPVERDLAPRSGVVAQPVQATKPVEQASVLSRAKKKLLHLPWKGESATAPATSSSAKNGTL